MKILTFDVEEWFHILDNASTRTEEQWVHYDVRIHRNLDRLLCILEETNTKATFFIVGWIAKNYPEVVKRIAEKYEIGSHTMSHQLVWQQTPQEFRKDVRASIELLQDLTGQPIKFFRAPGFSIRRSEIWALEILHELGIEIDCSIFPGYHAHGGICSYGKGEPTILDVNGKRIKELPINTYDICGQHMIYSGGGYFRLLPYWLIKTLVEKDSEYILCYIHPRDIDYEQPTIKELSLLRRFRSYVGLRGAEAKLRKFLTEFEFSDISSNLATYDWNHARVIAM